MLGNLFRTRASAPPPKPYRDEAWWTHATEEQLTQVLLDAVGATIKGQYWLPLARPLVKGTVPLFMADRHVGVAHCNAYHFCDYLEYDIVEAAVYSAMEPGQEKTGQAYLRLHAMSRSANWLKSYLLTLPDYKVDASPIAVGSGVAMIPVPLPGNNKEAHTRHEYVKSLIFTTIVP